MGNVRIEGEHAFGCCVDEDGVLKLHRVSVVALHNDPR